MRPDVEATLVYLQGAPLSRSIDGRLGVHHKTASGLQAYRARWQGPVAVSCLQGPSPAPVNSPELVWEGDDELDGVSVIGVTSSSDFVSSDRTLVHVAVNAPHVETIPAFVPTVLADDYSPAVRTHIAILGASGRTDAARIALGGWRRTRRFDALARRATGFHANGYASAAHYRRVNPHTLRYFDHRITREDLDTTRDMVLPVRRTLHIAYSGRLIGMKGVQYLPSLAQELRRRGIDARVSVIGGGPMEDELRQSSNGLLEFPGFLSFDSEWKPFVREHVDVMFLPHVQGDSSSTYYEAMGMGVPVLGFANATLTPLLSDGGAGWEVPRGDISRAVDVLEMLADDRDGALRRQRSRALDYMQDKNMESIFDMRVEDFRRVASERWG